MEGRRPNRITGLIDSTVTPRARWTSLALLAMLGLGACQGVIGDTPAGLGPHGTGIDPGGTGNPGSGGSAGSDGTGSGGSGGSDPGGTGGTGGGTTDGGPSAAAPLPARIRRLTNAEYDASVYALLTIDSKFGATFTPDARQDGFTRNDAQRVDPVFTMQIDDAATQLATQARAKFSTLAPCANPTSGGEACAKTFLAAFLPRAYRRPVVQRELDALIAVYRAGIDGLAYADGIEAVIHAVLVAPGFLYTTEIGAASGPPASAPMTITPYEAASAVAYLLTGAPPDDMLLAAAASGEIMKSDARDAHARRLLASTAASAQITRIVEEWLGIDRIAETGKDSNAYPEFAGLKDAMKKEADAFVNEVMWKTTHDVGDLLSADWTIADTNLASMYGGTPTPANGRVSLTSVPRRGVLNQGAFLSVYAHATESGPVLRGVAMLRRIACIDVASPTSLNIEVTPPVPDPTKTTRERFSVHSTDPLCASCHSKIDAFGFAFENFDGMGKVRTSEGTGVNKKDIDSTTTLAVGMDFDGSYPDSSALVVKLATSPKVRACFARHLFRASAATSDRATQPTEESFITAWNALPPEKQRNIVDVLATWLSSDAFVQRRAEP